MGVHDSVPLAEAFVTKLEGEKEKAKEQNVSAAEVRITELFSSYRELRQLNLRHPALSPMLVVA